MSEFFGHFREIFRRTPGRYFVIPLMFFDALKVPGPSQSDPGSIWETSFFDENFPQGKPEVKILSGSETDLESIDLSVIMWNPHQNNIKRG